MGHFVHSLALVTACTATAAAQAEGVTPYGQACGSAPTLALSGVPIAGGTLSYVPLGSLPGSLVILGVGFSDAVFLGLPLPLALDPFGFPPGCQLFTSSDLVFFEQEFGNLPLPATAVGVHLYCQLIEFDLVASAYAGTSEAYDVEILQPGLTITGLSTATGGDGTLVTLTGTGFVFPPENNCVAVTDRGLGIVKDGSPTHLTFRVHGGPATLGPVMVMTGVREQIDTAAFVYPAGSPPIDGITAFLGTESAATMGLSAIPFDLLEDPNFIPFEETGTTDAGEGGFPGLEFDMEFPDIEAGDKLRAWLRVKENGNGHDFWFNNGVNLTVEKEVVAAVAMNKVKAAQWARAWILQSMGPRIFGLQVTATGGILTMSVNNGTGLTGMKGGFSIILGGP